MQKIAKPIIHNIHYKIWAFFTALCWWYCIHALYQTIIEVKIPLDEDITLEETFITVHARLNKFSYYAGYHTKTKFFLDKKPLHGIIKIEEYMILPHPAVQVVDFYPRVLHVKQLATTYFKESLHEREVN